LLNSIIPAAAAEGASVTPPWVFGLVGFGGFVALLIITLMLKVGR
jgi:hypothetical protein